MKLMVREFLFIPRGEFIRDPNEPSGDRWGRGVTVSELFQTSEVFNSNIFWLLSEFFGGLSVILGEFSAIVDVPERLGIFAEISEDFEPWHGSICGHFLSNLNDHSAEQISSPQEL